jgi:hypothetical protein
MHTHDLARLASSIAYYSVSSCSGTSGFFSFELISLKPTVICVKAFRISGFISIPS